MWKCSFGLYGDRYEDKNRFGYMVDMLTLQAIDSGHLDQAFENVLQVMRWTFIKIALSKKELQEWKHADSFNNFGSIEF